MTVAASLVMSSAVYASEAVTGGSRGVDVVSAATGETPAPAPKPVPKPTPAPKPTPKPTPKPAPAPVATPKPTAPVTAQPTTLERTLTIGSKGADVKLVQALLNKNGFSLVADGIFGKKTATAVKSFQGKNALKTDGIVDSNTFAKLNGVKVTPDVVTSASLVNNIAAFEKGIGKDGKWIVTTLNDLTTDKALVLDGTFKNGKKNADGTDAIQRKIGLYTQDDKKVVTARFTLTAPSLTILSPNARIQSGTFKGDVYVSVPNFQLVDAKVDGNVYFTTQEAKDTFKMDAKSSITGNQILIQTDAVATASIVDNTAAFEKAISKDGTWIPCILRDMTIDKDLVLDGTFKNGKKNADGTDAIQRKIALYSQDDNKVVTRRFTLTAPKLTINSPNARIQGGIFKGELYVSVPNFQLVNAKVDGNVYFTTQEAKDTFKMDAKSSITGNQILIQTDAVATASIVDNTAAFEKAISKDGTWIPCVLRDMTIDKDLVLDGTFKNGKKNADGTDAIQRKIALYSQDDKKVVTRRFTLTAPKLTINSPNARIQGGIFKGELYVSVPNFQLVDAKVDGNVYFTTQEAKDTFKMDAKSSITGKQVLIQADAVTSASIVDNAAAFENGISKNGKWIISVVRDLVIDEELVLDGTFKNGKKNADGTDAIQRKISLYSQDAKKVVTRRFTLIAPKLTILSPNARIQGGTFKGDIYVSASNFILVDAKVEGNIYFTTREAMSTFTIDANSSVKGNMELKTN
jgi:peptidoglycan hydrolase-like protein with peptidoglycan-binding domain/aminoglycoside phosphotransferase family enzyme